MVLSDDFSKISLSVSVSSDNIQEDNYIELIDPENIYENTEVLTTGNFRESYYEELSDSENIYHNHELITTD